MQWKFPEDEREALHWSYGRKKRAPRIDPVPLNVFCSLNKMYAILQNISVECLYVLDHSRNLLLSSNMGIIKNQQTDSNPLPGPLV